MMNLKSLITIIIFIEIIATQTEDSARYVQVQSAVFLQLLASLSDTKVNQMFVMFSSAKSHCTTLLQDSLGRPLIPGP